MSRLCLGILLWAAVLSHSAPAEAQAVEAGRPVTQSPPTQPGGDSAGVPEANASQSANATRQRLQEVLRQYPPTVHDVLRLSPSLGSNASFLQPYPALSAFLTAHPEVLSNPSFYFGTRWVPDWEDATPAARRARAAKEMFGGMAAFIGLMSLLGVVTWFAHGIVAHLRWKRALRVQADAHAKILERLTNTEDVLTYVQTPAARRFLESGAPADPGPRGVTVPIARILWSVQMGTVMAVVGVGVFALAARLARDEAFGDMSPILSVVGTVILCVGVGFLLSALVSYLLSRRLGLLAPTEPQHG